MVPLYVAVNANHYLFNIGKAAAHKEAFPQKTTPSRYGAEFLSTVKPVYNDHPWDPKMVAVVDRWSLFRGTFVL